MQTVIDRHYNMNGPHYYYPRRLYSRRRG